MSPATTTFGRAGAGNVHIESDRQSASETPEAERRLEENESNVASLDATASQRTNNALDGRGIPAQNTEISKAQLDLTGPDARTDQTGQPEMRGRGGAGNFLDPNVAPVKRTASPAGASEEEKAMLLRQDVEKGVEAGLARPDPAWLGGRQEASSNEAKTGHGP